MSTRLSVRYPARIGESRDWVKNTLLELEPSKMRAMDMLLHQNGRVALGVLVEIISEEMQSEQHDKALEWLAMRFEPEEIALLNRDVSNSANQLTIEGNMTLFKVLNQRSRGLLYHQVKKAKVGLRPIETPRKTKGQLALEYLMGEQELPQKQVQHEPLPEDIKAANREFVQRVREDGAIRRREAERELNEKIAMVLRDGPTRMGMLELLAPPLAPVFYRILENGRDATTITREVEQIEDLFTRKVKVFDTGKGQAKGSQKMHAKNAIFLEALLRIDEEAQHIFATWPYNNPLLRSPAIKELHSLYAPPQAPTSADPN